MDSKEKDDPQSNEPCEESGAKELLFNPLIDRRAFIKGMAGVLGVSALGIGKGYANTDKNEIVVEKVPVKISNLPKAFKGFKIAQLSDLHSSPLVSVNHLKAAAILAKKENPDLVVLTGDFIGHKIRTHRREIHEFDKQYVDNIVEALSVLKPAHGIFSVLGNHDFWSGPEATQYLIDRFSKGLGAQWLRNDRVELQRGRDSIQLIGVDDLWQDSFSLRKAYRKVDHGRTRILLSHNPEVNEEFQWNPGLSAELILSGHTHGGQVVLPFIGPPFLPGIRNKKYIAGLVEEKGRQTYVTRGIGHLVVPLRFNCPPEVSLIELV
ncbi:MAG: metallophosphoesterase [Candidatus Nitronauta litoralis]|uniref:Metallophosphoesterase n=1 Tax=Candidatus Nitronauta litoralis TaxID=2705533 RepID=A0A7T0BZ23_9BACT|nr:MAG: metallophosphoesterase [Candidatus Nitronauta litoralis]